MAGRNALERVVDLEKRCEALRRRVRSLQNDILLGNNIDFETRETSIQELERAHDRLFAEKQTSLKELGAQDREKLADLPNMTFINDRMNAHALHARLLSKLQNRKFELRYLER